MDRDSAGALGLDTMRGVNPISLRADGHTDSADLGHVPTRAVPLTDDEIRYYEEEREENDNLYSAEDIYADSIKSIDPMAASSGVRSVAVRAQTATLLPGHEPWGNRDTELWGEPAGNPFSKDYVENGAPLARQRTIRVPTWGERKKEEASAYISDYGEAYAVWPRASHEPIRHGGAEWETRPYNPTAVFDAPPTDVPIPTSFKQAHALVSDPPVREIQLPSSDPRAEASMDYTAWHPRVAAQRPSGTVDPIRIAAFNQTDANDDALFTESFRKLTREEREEALEMHAPPIRTAAAPVVNPVSYRLPDMFNEPDPRVRKGMSPDYPDVGANGMMQPLPSEPVSGTGRYYDVGSAHASVPNSNAQFFFGPTTDPILGKYGPSAVKNAQEMRHAARLDPRAMFDNGKVGFGEGMNTDMAFTGVWVDPYTGIEYDAYEQEAPPPQGDFRHAPSVMQAHFQTLMGQTGENPGRGSVHKKEIINDDPEPEGFTDAPEDIVRARSMERATWHNYDIRHDESAWTDAEGYAQMVTGIPYNSAGEHEVVKLYPVPDWHLHRDREGSNIRNGAPNNDSGPHMWSNITNIRAIRPEYSRSTGAGAPEGLEGSAGLDVFGADGNVKPSFKVRDRFPEIVHSNYGRAAAFDVGAPFAGTAHTRLVPWRNTTVFEDAYQSRPESIGSNGGAYALPQTFVRRNYGMTGRVKETPPDPPVRTPPPPIRDGWGGPHIRMQRRNATRDGEPRALPTGAGVSASLWHRTRTDDDDLESDGIMFERDTRDPVFLGFQNNAWTTEQSSHDDGVYWRPKTQRLTFIKDRVMSEYGRGAGSSGGLEASSIGLSNMLQRAIRKDHWFEFVPGVDIDNLGSVDGRRVGEDWWNSRQWNNPRIARKDFVMDRFGMAAPEPSEHHPYTPTTRHREGRKVQHIETRARGEYDQITTHRTGVDADYSFDSRYAEAYIV